MRSFSGKPSIETFLESRLDRMRGGLKQGMIARLRARGANIPDTTDKPNADTIA
jgi:hypothetical protein